MTDHQLYDTNKYTYSEMDRVWQNTIQMKV